VTPKNYFRFQYLYLGIRIAVAMVILQSLDHLRTLMNRFKNIAFALLLVFGLFAVAPSASATIDDVPGGLASVTTSKAANGVTVLSGKPPSGPVEDPNFWSVQIKSGTYTLSDPFALVLLGASLVSFGAWGRRRMKRRTNAA
jgi:hypothetical protein